ncbi:hypothetical protein P171DRAFT_496445 [Karstenula rhodostoma CBS 690.94]|uniref:F-box domain-containing protein n=1 Tax=Karstenula rhodostoma CBS 690.94 TaxID=1392251 RepID=A0A9P4PDN8_9PLEO|nr:hypothetical protein P171DRAFT_496445 [Karstenula rhodostoma CBS 690.94]
MTACLGPVRTQQTSWRPLGPLSFHLHLNSSLKRVFNISICIVSSCRPLKMASPSPLSVLQSNHPHLPIPPTDRELMGLRSTPSTSSVTFNFPGLPGEIRNNIYAQVILDLPPLPELRAVRLFEKCTLPKDAFPLAHVSKQVRKEYFNMFLVRLNCEIAWSNFSIPIAQSFFATGSTGAQPGSLVLEVGLGDQYSRVDLLSLVWLCRQHNSTSRYVGLGFSPAARADLRLPLFCNRLEALVQAFTGNEVSFRPSKLSGTPTPSFGAFTHIYVDQGIKSEGDAEWVVDVLIVLEQPWKTLSKEEWHVLLMVYSVLRRLNEATVRVEENVDGIVRKYVCENQSGSGLRVVPVSEEDENSALE